MPSYWWYSVERDCLHLASSYITWYYTATLAPLPYYLSLPFNWTASDQLIGLASLQATWKVIITGPINSKQLIRPPFTALYTRSMMTTVMIVSSEKWYSTPFLHPFRLNLKGGGSKLLTNFHFKSFSRTLADLVIAYQSPKDSVRSRLPSAGRKCTQDLLLCISLATHLHPKISLATHPHPKPKLMVAGP